MVEIDEIIRDLAQTYEFDESEVRYLYSKLLEYPVFNKACEELKAECLEVLLQKMVSGEIINEYCTYDNEITQTPFGDVRYNIEEYVEYSVKYIFGEQDCEMSLSLELY